MDVIRGKRVLVDGFTDAIPACIMIQEGKIVQIVEGYEIPDSKAVYRQIVDAGDYVVMAGLVDTNVQTCEPRRTDCEGLVSITGAAAAGGYTTILDVPYSCQPVASNVEKLFDKIALAKRKCFVDIGFWGGIVPKNKNLARSLVKGGVCGLSLTLNPQDESETCDEDTAAEALRELRNTGCSLQINVAGAGNNQPGGDVTSYARYLEVRPPLAELDGVKKVVEWLRNCGGETPCHIMNLSCGDAVQTIRDAQKEGLPLSAETCPHYLILTASDIPEGATLFKCDPPIRDERHQALLWEGIKDGVIRQVVSNHSPCSPDMKLLDKGDFFFSRPGIPASMQLGLPLLWTAAQERGLSLTDLQSLLSTGPAITAGLDHRKGRIATEYDADFVIWDPEETFVVRENDILHKYKSTCPYIGRTLKGVVKSTLCRGQTVFSEGNLIVEQRPAGNILLSGELGSEVGRFGEISPGSGVMLTRRRSVLPAMVSVGEEKDDFKCKRRNSYFE